MKKLFSVLIAMVLVVSMSVIVFAAGTPIENYASSDNTTSGTVVVKIGEESIEKITRVYSVNLEWDSLDFTYSFSEYNGDSWDPATHTYGSVDYVGQNWDKNNANIKVINHSNASVGVLATFEDDATAKTVNGVTATLSNNEFVLATAEGTTLEEAPNDSVNLSIRGVPTKDQGFDVGTITVALSQAD